MIERYKGEVPTKIHFTIINVASWQATGQTEKRMINIELTDEQKEYIISKLADGQEIFDCYIEY